MTAPSPLPVPRDKGRYVRDMFSAIAPRYGLRGRLLSLNTDRRWRREAVDRLGWQRQAGGLYLDGCAGTLDLAVELARRPGFSGLVVGADFAPEMLRHGAGKAGSDRVAPAAADALELPFPDETFDGAMVGFGVRNLSDLDAGLGELLRVLKPRARAVILEFTTPRWPPLRALYLFYFRHVLPVLGGAISGHPSAYRYLPASVGQFPEPQALRARLERAGYQGCGFRLLSGGIAAIHWGERGLKGVR